MQKAWDVVQVSWDRPAQESEKGLQTVPGLQPLVRHTAGLAAWAQQLSVLSIQ
jgi:hypothetical protein